MRINDIQNLARIVDLGLLRVLLTMIDREGEGEVHIPGLSCADKAISKANMMCTCTPSQHSWPRSSTSQAMYAVYRSTPIPSFTYSCTTPIPILTYCRKKHQIILPSRPWQQPSFSAKHVSIKMQYEKPQHQSFIPGNLNRCRSSPCKEPISLPSPQPFKKEVRHDDEVNPHWPGTKPSSSSLSRAP